MKLYFFFVSFCLPVLFCNAQVGCTDTLALNFDSIANVNDGSCIYAKKEQKCNLIASLASELTESSGLTMSDGFLWTHNDSGNPSKIYKIDTITGQIIQTLFVTNAANNDWEDITADSDYLYIGDCGNNNGIRTDLKILKISKSQFISSTETFVNVTAEEINFSYKDQTSFVSNKSNNFDCEAILSKGDSIYLFTKNRGDWKTKLYAVSKIPGSYVLSPRNEFDVKGLITGADYNENTGEIALIGYTNTSFVYFLTEYFENDFFSGNIRRVEIGHGALGWQTEAITYTSDQELYVSCEFSNVPASLYLTNKTDLAFLSIQNVPPLGVTFYPNPAHSNLTIESSELLKTLSFISLNGKLILSEAMNTNQFDLDVSTLPSGLYLVVFETNKSKFHTKITIQR
jgi:hypothetical protein